MKDNQIKEKRHLKQRVNEILDDYLISEPEEKRAVIHMEFEHLNGERQSKTLWFVMNGFNRDGTAVDEFETTSADELEDMEFYPSYLDNPDQRIK